MERYVTNATKLLALPFLFFVAFFLVPLGVVFVSSLLDTKNLSFSLINYTQILLDQYHWEIIYTTFRIGIITTIICLLLGYPLAWYLVRVVRSKMWMRICIIILVVPLFTSNIVRSFGWMIMLGRNGLVNDVLQFVHLTDGPIRLLGTETGILIGLVYILLPFAVLSIGTALSRIDLSLEHASSDLGASSLSTFFFVTLPLTLPGVAAGGVMVFALTVSAYVTPAVLSGGKITVLPMLIYQQYSTVFNFNFGGALSIVLLVLTLALVVIANHIGRNKAEG
jgi:putative spermidine/putrescine transport system permease protein